MNQEMAIPARPFCSKQFRAATAGLLVLVMLLAVAGSKAACGDPRSSRPRALTMPWLNHGNHDQGSDERGFLFDANGISGTFTVDETDTVEPGGKTHKGTFDFKAFDPGGRQVAEVKGTTLGTRIAVD